MNWAIIIASTFYTIDKALDLYKKYLACIHFIRIHASQVIKDKDGKLS